MWIDVATFRNLTGLTTPEISDEQIQENLSTSSMRIRSLVLIRKRYETYHPDTEHRINDTNFASIDGETIDKNDIEAFEIDKDYKIYNLNSHITSFDSDSGWVVFDNEYPTSHRKLVIRYWRGKFKWEEEYQLLRDLQRWMTLKLLFENIPFTQLQEGVSSWSLNGVSISDGSSSISSVLRDIDEKVRKKIIFLQSYYGKGYR